MARILLIDDDNTFRTTLSGMLTHYGHTVFEACNGREGLGLFDDCKPDLVITDIIMPEKEGLEVVVELHKKSPYLKIIAMSGGGLLDADNYLYMANVLGAAKVLVKPFSAAVLMAALAEVLPDEAAPALPSAPVRDGQ